MKRERKLERNGIEHSFVLFAFFSMDQRKLKKKPTKEAKNVKKHITSHQ